MSSEIWTAIIGAAAVILTVVVTKLINRGTERVGSSSTLWGRIDKLETDVGDMREKLFLAVRFIYQQERHAIAHNLPPLPIPDELQDVL